MKYSRRNSKTKRRGGNVGTTVDYGNASNWMLNTVGTANQQYDNVFSVDSPFPAKGNTIVSLDGKHYAGGKRRRYKNSKRARGGNLAQVINQAVVPLGLLGLQQTYRRKKGGKKGSKTRRHRHKY